MGMGMSDMINVILNTINIYLLNNKSVFNIMCKTEKKKKERLISNI